ncbi:hypothetical protein HK098_000278, partial [Nowakowskiella sp. JEL0407]
YNEKRRFLLHFQDLAIKQQQQQIRLTQEENLKQTSRRFDVSLIRPLSRDPNFVKCMKNMKEFG